MLVQLQAEGFRNLESLDLSFGRGVHLVLGDNGAGKTSLLEAIYVLATTRSFRTAQIADCCRHGAERFRLAAEVEAASRARLELEWTKGERQRALNGHRTSLAEHLAVLPIVAWTTADLDVLIGPPKERRRFLDRGVVGRHPAALGVISRYRRTLREKRQLLGRRATAAERESWDRLLSEAGADLIRRRAAYVEALGAALIELLAACDLGIPEVTLRYRPSPKGGLDAESFFRAIAAVAAREQKLERPLLGPHRDRLEILWGGRPVRRVASAGERKALGLALTAAHGEVLKKSRREPLVLLDDVDTELDRGRLEALWAVLGRGQQLFATSNRPWVWERVEVDRRWRLTAGGVVEA